MGNTPRVISDSITKSLAPFRPHLSEAFLDTLIKYTICIYISPQQPLAPVPALFFSVKLNTF